jgi:hypothetical protein
MNVNSKGAIMKVRIITIVVALTAVLVLIPGVAHAHDTSGVPYHTTPTGSSLWRYADGSCQYGFTNPIALGFTSEYVYWRPMGAFVANGAWQYRYGEWRRALTNRTQMVYGWEAQQPWTNAWGFANGDSVVGGFPRGSSVSLGYQIFYSSNGYTHAGWRGVMGC